MVLPAPYHYPSVPVYEDDDENDILRYMEESIKHNQIIEQLERLNAQVSRQNSIRRVFCVGVIYGIGFFVGSAIIATIALGIFGPYFGQIPWVRNAFETGLMLKR